MKLELFFLLTVLLGPLLQPRCLAAPRILYSDLESGPKTGGQHNQGVFVTIYGNGFGSMQGTSQVTVGGGAVAAYPVWTDSKVTVQLGSQAASGDVVVTTSGGSSNAIPFTVRSGKIYFVSPAGKDSSSGSFTSPWQTLLKARDSMKPGDITYAMDGVRQTADDGQGWAACMLLQTSGAPGMPIAMVAYPGATAVIGNSSSPNNGIRSKGLSSYWVIAGFQLTGGTSAIASYGDNHWRVIGNDMTCPNGNYATACFETSVNTYFAIYGNSVHDAGVANASALYHGVYFSTDSNHIDFGWNSIANVHGCRGLQVHSSPLNGGGANDPTGHDQYDLSIHDNIIHDTQCDGIILATIDPSKGAIKVFNNVIYNAGKGPNNPEGSGYWSCINVESYTNTGPAGSGTVEVFNNTLFNCGTFANPPYGNANGGIAYSGPNGNIKVHIHENLVNVPSGRPYLIVNKPGAGLCSLNDNCPWMFGAGNAFFGSGPPPVNTYITGSLMAQFAFLDAPHGDFRLREPLPHHRVGVQFETMLSAPPGVPSHRPQNR